MASYRPEYEHARGSKTYHTEIRVDPLPAARAQELLGTLLGAAPDVARLGHRLIEITEGHPFFLEETVRTLVETGVLTGERGGYELGQSLEGEKALPYLCQAGARASLRLALREAAEYLPRVLRLRTSAVTARSPNEAIRITRTEVEISRHRSAGFSLRKQPVEEGADDAVGITARGERKR